MTDEEFIMWLQEFLDLNFNDNYPEKSLDLKQMQDLLIELIG